MLSTVNMLKKEGMYIVHLDHQDTRPIYTQIADNFCNQILAGALVNGNKLPSIRELANELACNPNTIQRAYRELEAGGWITSVSGKGSFVCIQQEEISPELVPIWAELDAAAENLLNAGITPQALIQHLKQRKPP